MLQFKARSKSLFRKYWCLLIICFLCTILGTTLHDTPNQAVNWELEPADSSGLRVGSSQIETDNLWRTAQVNSSREALIPNGMGFIYHEPEDFSIQWQLEDIHRLTREGVDYLVTVSVNLSALTLVLQDARDAGIPIILIDQSAETIDQGYYVSLISVNYLKEGQICAGLPADKFADQLRSVVEIYSTEGLPGAQARPKGFHRVFMQYPNMEIIDVEYGNFDRAAAQKAMGNAFIKAASRGQTIDAVFAHSDGDGLGALQAIKVVGSPPGKILTVPINGIQDVCKAIVVEEYLDTVENNPRWGFITAFLIQQMERDCRPFPMVMIPYQIITAENAAEYVLTAY